MSFAVWCIVFGATAAIEALWALYVRAVADRRPIRAGLVSMAQHLFGAACVIEYTVDARYLIPLSLGACAGSMLGVALMGDPRG